MSKLDMKFKLGDEVLLDLDGESKKEKFSLPTMVVHWGTLDIHMM